MSCCCRSTSNGPAAMSSTAPPRTRRAWSVCPGSRPCTAFCRLHDARRSTRASVGFGRAGAPHTSRGRRHRRERVLRPPGRRAARARRTIESGRSGCALVSRADRSRAGGLAATRADRSARIRGRGTPGSLSRRERARSHPPRRVVLPAGLGGHGHRHPRGRLLEYRPPGDRWRRGQARSRWRSAAARRRHRCGAARPAPR